MLNTAINKLGEITRLVTQPEFVRSVRGTERYVCNELWSEVVGRDSQPPRRVSRQDSKPFGVAKGGVRSQCRRVKNEFHPLTMRDDPVAVYAVESYHRVRDDREHWSVIGCRR